MRYFERAQTEASRQVVEASGVPSFLRISNSAGMNVVRQ